MKIYDILSEASDDSGDYQQMLAFTRANRVGGVPDDQQIPLALFKELKKQQQQNQALGAELDAAEQRIDQATASGELSQKELGMHRTELDRERAAGDEQKATVTQLGQQYSEREQASKEQIKQLTGQLEQVRNMPGVNQDSVDKLEKQIQDLSKTGIGADKVQELERSIAAIQNAESADDVAIKDLIAQVKDAQAATAELSKTKQSIKQDVSKTVQDTQNQVAQLKQDIQRLQQVEKEVKDLEPKVDSLTKDKIIRDKIALRNTGKAFGKALATGALPSGTPIPTGSVSDPQMQPPVAESAFARSVAWATGKQP